MAFIARVRKIDMVALRAHRAFPLVVIGWLVLLLGAGAYVVQGSALHAALGAIAGGLLGRYLVTRMSGTAESTEYNELGESEREGRLRRVLGPETEEDKIEVSEDADGSIDEDPDADLARILTSREPKPQPALYGALSEDAENSDVESTGSHPLAADDAAPQYLSIEELQLDGTREKLDLDGATDDGENDGEDDGSDDAWPAETPEWANPGAALAAANGTSPELAEEPAQLGPEPEPAIVAEPGEHAAAKLRSQDLAQMSLVQMIERLAFAMDDYREMQDRKSIAAAITRPEQSEQMAEALRTLPALSRAAGVYATDGNAALDLSTREEAEATEDALRNALEKLQKLSGG